MVVKQRRFSEGHCTIDVTQQNTCIDMTVYIFVNLAAAARVPEERSFMGDGDGGGAFSRFANFLHALHVSTRPPIMHPGGDGALVLTGTKAAIVSSMRRIAKVQSHCEE